MSKNVCFLLGAGASIPAKLPGVSDITRDILTGEKFMWHTSGKFLLTYRRASSSDFDAQQWNEHVRPVLLLLSWLKVQAERRYAAWPGRVVNYEDIAYLAR